MGKILVDVDPPGNQHLQALAVTCRYRAGQSALDVGKLSRGQKRTRGLTFLRLWPTAGRDSLPLLAASCVGEGRQDSHWALAPYSSRSSAHAALPREQALNKGVTPSIVVAFTWNRAESS